MGCQTQKQPEPEEPVEEEPPPPEPIVVTEEMKSQFLIDAGFEGGVVVESAHPYEAEHTNWSQYVELPGETALATYFCPRSCTYDNGTCIRIFAGGQNRNTAGPGGRMEVEIQGGGKINCTITEFDRDNGMRKVLLDRREQTAAQGKQDATYQVGDTVEAQRDGEWVPATVEEITVTREWYYAKRAPSQCKISWMDGEGEEAKPLSALRMQKQAGRSVEDHLGTGPRHAYMLDTQQNCFAVVSDTPQAVWVEYTDMKVGDEIAEFIVDSSMPLTPIMVKSFASDSGPAQDSGVQAGWFLDILGMEAADKSMWSGLLQALDGLAGLFLPAGDDDAEPEVPDDHISKLIDTALNNPKELQQRLNEVLTGKDAKLLFTNSCSAKSADLLGEAKIRYPKGQKVGSEVKTFTKTPGGVKVLEFLCEGPAQAAGVSMDWTLDLKQTLASVRQQDASFTPQMLQDNPNKLLSLSDVTITFYLKKRGQVKMFEAYGPADVPEPSLLTCLKPSEVPDSSDTWLTTGADTLKQTSGKYYHEVKLDEISTTPQIGWLADSLEAGVFDNRGVGDDEHGWAVDGVRSMNWHRGNTPATWPRPWQQGDVIGFALDLDGGEMRCSMNGQWIDATSTAFNPNNRALYPAVSLKGLFTLNIPPQTWVYQAPDDSYTAWADTGNYTRPLLQRWRCPTLPGKSAVFEFVSDGGGKEAPDRRWGVWALVLPESAKAPTDEELETLMTRWMGEVE